MLGFYFIINIKLEIIMVDMVVSRRKAGSRNTTTTVTT